MVASLQLIRKFQALTNRVDEVLAKVYRTGRGDKEQYNYDPLDVSPLFDRWVKVREELVAAEPELVDIPECFPPKPTETTDCDGRGLIYRPPIERMRNHMRDAWDILNHPSRQIPQVSIDREGIFVAGQPFDAMLAITSILRAAKKSITVVDGYVSDQTLSILAVKADPVAPRILTLPKSASTALVAAAKAFNAQYGAGPPLEIKTSAAFHDRFIVVDDADYYHFGTSIKDAARKSAFMFSRIEEPSIVAALSATIAKEWGAASVVGL